MGFFSSCGEEGLLSSCSGFSCCRARARECVGSVAVAHGLSCSSACEIFPTRDGIRVSHIGRHLSFALEGDIISKAVHYTNTLKKIFWNKRAGSSLFTKCAEMQETDKELFLNISVNS